MRRTIFGNYFLEITFPTIVPRYESQEGSAKESQSRDSRHVGMSSNYFQMIIPFLVMFLVMKRL